MFDRDIRAYPVLTVYPFLLVLYCLNTTLNNVSFFESTSTSYDLIKKKREKLNSETNYLQQKC